MRTATGVLTSALYLEMLITLATWMLITWMRFSLCDIYFISWW